MKGNLDYSEDELVDLLVNPEKGNYNLKEDAKIYSDNPEFKNIYFSRFYTTAKDK